MLIPSPIAKRRPRIEIIPLIDVVFFLLATFVMVSLSMVKNRGISVKLPTSVTAAPQKQDIFATVSVSADGTVYLDKQLVAVEELKERLAALRSEDERLRVFIQGDEQASFGSAISVLDVVRLAGITDISIQTKTPAAKPE